MPNFFEAKNGKKIPITNLAARVLQTADADNDKDKDLNSEERAKLAEAIKTGLNEGAKQKFKTELIEFAKGAINVDNALAKVVYQLNGLKSEEDLKIVAEPLGLAYQNADRLQKLYISLLSNTRTAAGKVEFTCNDFADSFLSGLLPLPDAMATLDDKVKGSFLELKGVETGSNNTRDIQTAWTDLQGEFTEFVANFKMDVLARINWNETETLNKLSSELLALQKELDKANADLAAVHAQGFSLNAPTFFTGISGFFSKFFSGSISSIFGNIHKEHPQIPDPGPAQAKVEELKHKVDAKKKEIDGLQAEKASAQGKIQQLAIQLSVMEQNFKNTCQMLGVFTDVWSMIRSDLLDIMIKMETDDSYCQNVEDNTSSIAASYKIIANMLKIFGTTVA